MQLVWASSKKAGFSLKWRHYQLNFNWWFSIVTLLVFVILLKLGFWQIQRYHEKLHILSQYQTAAHGHPLTITQVQSLQKDGNYFSIQFQGNYLNNRSLLLDNKTHRGQVGYEVISIFSPAHHDKKILINRGWIPLGASRQQLPKLIPVIGQQTILGRAKFIRKQMLTLSAHTIEKNTWPIRIQTINFQQLEQVTGFRFYHFIVLLGKKQEHGFIRQWKVVNTKPAKHLGYALQWFAMSIGLLILFIAMNFKINSSERKVNGSKK